MVENSGKSTRVNDPVQRLLMAIAIGLATWAITQVQKHSEALSAISMQVQHLEGSVSSAESRSGRITDDLHRDIREIRNIIERKP